MRFAILLSIVCSRCSFSLPEYCRDISSAIGQNPDLDGFPPLPSWLEAQYASLHLAPIAHCHDLGGSADQHTSPSADSLIAHQRFSLKSLRRS
jgi:hypothetical protein